MDNDTHAALHKHEEDSRHEIAKMIAMMVNGIESERCVVIPALLAGEKILVVCVVQAQNTDRAALLPVFIYSPELLQTQVERTPCMEQQFGLQAAVTLAEIKHPGVSN